MKKLYGLLVLIMGFSSCTDPAAPGTDTLSPYSFFVAGHVFGAFVPEDHQGLYPPFRERSYFVQQDLEVEFGVFTGDMVVFPNEATFDSLDREIEAFGVPVYMVPGNHDLLDSASPSLFEQRYGARYYGWEFHDDLFIFLDPNDAGWSIPPEQIQMIQDLLASAPQAKNVFLFHHQLLWWQPGDSVFGAPFVSPNSASGRQEPVNFWPEVVPLFAEHPGEIWFFGGDTGARCTGVELGYWHDDDRLHLIQSGMGCENRSNYLIVEVDMEHQVNVRIIALDREDFSWMGTLNHWRYPR